MIMHAFGDSSVALAIPRGHDDSPRLSAERSRVDAQVNPGERRGRGLVIALVAIAVGAAGLGVAIHASLGSLRDANAARQAAAADLAASRRESDRAIREALGDLRDGQARLADEREALAEELAEAIRAQAARAAASAIPASRPRQPAQAARPRPVPKDSVKEPVAKPRLEISSQVDDPLAGLE